MSQSRRLDPLAATSGLLRLTDIVRSARLVPILLQKSKVASDEIFGQIPKREAIADSYVLSRLTELAYDFNAR
jgi:hypothetical protein